MRSDHEVERILEDWLEDEARTMPEPVMNSIVEEAKRHSQLGPRRGLGLNRPAWRAALTLATAGLAVLLVLIAPPLVNLVATLVGGPSNVGQPAEGAMHWDAMLQFREYPNQLNPAPDGYGHQTVFTYLYASGPTHDPTQYVPLSQFETSDRIERWYDPEVDVHVGRAPGPDGLELHPGGGGADSHAAIIAWRNPVEASLIVAGSVEVDASCGDGIVFSIEHGSDTVEGFELAGGSRSFRFEAEAFHSGDVLHFIVDPGTDNRCDTTLLNLTIDTR